MKMLRASVRSSQKIDQASERIFNVVFYAVIGCVALAALGLDPLAIFVSLSTIVLAFSFMISRASSNYFEGEFVHAWKLNETKAGILRQAILNVQF